MAVDLEPVSQTVWMTEVDLDTGITLESGTSVVWQSSASVGVLINLDAESSAIWQSGAQVPVYITSANPQFTLQTRTASFGPGSGFVVVSYIHYWRELQESDWVNLILPYAGVRGLTGLARVAEVSFDDQSEAPQVTFVMVPQITERTPVNLMGSLPNVAPSPDDVYRVVEKHGRRMFDLEQG